MRLLPIQIILVPLGLVFSIILMNAGMRNGVREASPVMRSAAAVQRWVDHESEARQCLRWSIDTHMIQQDGVPTDPGKGHWFATLRCSQPGIYAWWAILIIGPWLFMNLVLLAFVRMLPAEARHDGHDREAVRPIGPPDRIGILAPQNDDRSHRE